jgi:hypothetical protein
MVEEIERLFPKLQGTAYRITSPSDDVYNCIAWAAGVTDAWWWPFGDPSKIFWPAGVPRQETMETFRRAFATLGYAECDHAEAESGFEKIALFADTAGCPTHAARQLPDGRWTSKLGALVDIEHALDDLEGTEYGSVVQIMKRSLPTAGRESS